MENYQIAERMHIDFAEKGVPPRVYAKQYDSHTRVVAVGLYDNGVPYIVPQGYQVNIRLDKRDGHYVYNPALFEVANTVLVILTRQMLTSPGELLAEIEVVQGANELKSATFVIACEPSTIPDEAIESTDEYKTVQEILTLVEDSAKIVTDNKEAIDAIPGQISDIQDLVDQAEAARDAASESKDAAAESASAAAGKVEDAAAEVEKAQTAAAQAAASEDKARQYAETAASASSGYKGFYTTPEALRAAYPVGENGWIATVGRTGDDDDDTQDTIWAWDSDANDWIDTNRTQNWKEIPTWADLAGKLLVPCNCIYSDGTHEITLQSVKQIPGDRYTIVMVPTHDYIEGDAVTVAGEPMTLHYSKSNVDVRTGAWQVGKPVQVEVNGGALYIQGGPPALEAPREYTGNEITISTCATDILAPSWEGKTTVIGEPSPDNPATITGVPFAATATGPDGQTRSVDLGIIGYSLPDGTADTFDGVRGDFVQRVGKLVLDGTEDWLYRSEASTGYIRFYAKLNGAKYIFDKRIEVTCTHFLYSGDTGDTNTVFLYGYNEIESIYICAPIDVVGDGTNTFKSWLAAQKSAGTPVTVLYELETPIANNRKADIHAFEGQTIVTGADTVEVIDGREYRLLGMTPHEIAMMMVFPNAGSHNSIYRGKYLGTTYTAAQQAAVAAGTFDDLYIGDYWTIGGVNYRIAGFDYYLRCGDTDLMTHHVVIVPDSNLYNAKMNESNTTEGGYVGSAMYKTGLEQAKTTAAAAFGSAHILSHREFLTNAVSNGRPSGASWYDCTVELMNEQMVYGGAIFSPTSDGTTVPFNYRVEKSQLPLFTHRPDLISNRQMFWLRDVVTAADFADVYYDGNARYNSASDSSGVRPAIPVS